MGPHGAVFLHEIRHPHLPRHVPRVRRDDEGRDAPSAGTRLTTTPIVIAALFRLRLFRLSFGTSSRLRSKTKTRLRFAASPGPRIVAWWTCCPPVHRISRFRRRIPAVKVWACNEPAFEAGIHFPGWGWSI